MHDGGKTRWDGNRHISDFKPENAVKDSASSSNIILKGRVTKNVYMQKEFF